ncbi:RidA family protein [Falsiroseomonas tokyonensis]|uniref:RidA family protein n=1 Tax=Falsiroseomonas tokyonensis TaxID=430521 RepID=A0ABV7BYP2_9PROT|nr:RidA family protein [Falsiroseomonas tokyonensis]MBU8540756.1 RidA family protein [Falsiroseomonas tokyonensis]
MTVTFSNPDGVHAPGARYAHAALVEGPGRRLVISGQIGVAPDGTVAAAGADQIAQAFRNLRAVLAAHGMAPEHIVKLGVFLTDRALIPAFRAQRDAVLGPICPCSTLLIVAGLADPRFVFEVEAEAFSASDAGAASGG